MFYLVKYLNKYKNNQGIKNANISGFKIILHQQLGNKAIKLITPRENNGVVSKIVKENKFTHPPKNSKKLPNCIPKFKISTS